MTLIRSLPLAVLTRSFYDPKRRRRFTLPARSKYLLAPLGASCYKDAPEGALIMNRKTVAINIGLLRSRAAKFICAVAVVVLILHALSDSAIAQPSTNRVKPEAAIRTVLDAQAAAWNRGDVEAYMDGYDRSPNTEFVGGDSITRGWQEVLDRYKKRYDTRDKMGTLTFSDLEIKILSADAALVLGRWRLKRASDEPHGTFTLLFRKTKAGWRIVHDHTSAA
jgi:ketosteroid isomerase-like protein